MLECLILGDSLARGVADARTECVQHTQVGISSGRFLVDLMPAKASARTAVISLGVNDSRDVATQENLRSVRGRVHASVVYWLLPGIKDHVREMIRTVAMENGDRVIETGRYTGPDHLHPTGAGYQIIARRTEGDGPARAPTAPVEYAYAPDRFTPMAPLPETPREPRYSAPRDFAPRDSGPPAQSEARTLDERRQHAVTSVARRKKAGLERVRHAEPGLFACGKRRTRCAEPVQHTVRHKGPKAHKPSQIASRKDRDHRAARHDRHEQRATAKRQPRHVAREARRESARKAVTARSERTRGKPG